MTKKHIVIGVIVSVIAVAIVLAFGAFMAGKAHDWSSEQRMLSAPLQIAVNAGNFIQSYPLGIGLAVIGGCFCSVWLVGMILVKRLR